jgi:nitrogen fixation/metabolism regulation signal transduction histidine kinase
MNKRPYLHKRSLLVDRNIQIPILVYSVAVSTLGVTLAAAFAVYGAHLINFRVDFTSSLIFVVGCAFFCYSIMMIAGLYLTNKIAGPIYRMHMHMKEVCEGKSPEPLTTRDDDFVNKDLIKQYNQLLEKLKN